MRVAAALLLSSVAAASSAEPRLPEGYLPVPLIRQATSYSCGPAALAGVLAYWQVFDGRESELYAPLKTSPEEGTPPPNLAAYARSLGLKAEVREGLSLEDIRKAWRRGETVILDIQAWPGDEERIPRWEDRWEDGHYVVLVGMDEAFVYLMDPSLLGRYGYIPLDELPKRWHDYENQGGKRREYLSTGIVISGRQRLRRFPAPLERVR